MTSSKDMTRETQASVNSRLPPEEREKLRLDRESSKSGLMTGSVHSAEVDTVASYDSSKKDKKARRRSSVGSTGRSKSTRRSSSRRLEREHQAHSASMSILMGPSDAFDRSSSRFADVEGEITPLNLDSVNEKRKSPVRRSSVHAPPRGAIENARQFLWEDDEAQKEPLPQRGWKDEEEGALDVVPTGPVKDDSSPGGNVFSKAWNAVAPQAASDAQDPHPAGYSVSFGRAGNNTNGEGQGPFSNVGYASKAGGGETESLFQSMKDKVWGPAEDETPSKRNIAPRRESTSDIDPSHFASPRRSVTSSGANDHDPWWARYHDTFVDWKARVSHPSTRSGLRKKCIVLAAILVLLLGVLSAWRAHPPSFGNIITRPDVVDADEDEDEEPSSGGYQGDDKDMAFRYGLIEQRLIDSGLSLASELGMDGSSQNLAIEWIALFDDANLDPEHPILLQRYALAVFFFSTYADDDIYDYEDLDGDEAGTARKLDELGWIDWEGWLSGKSHCTWYGVECQTEAGLDMDMGSVTHLNLTSNNLKGYLPYEINGLPDLQLLDVDGNFLTADIPKTIGDLSDLEILYLSNNGFTGTIPTEIGMLSSLTELFLGENDLEGTIPTELGSLTPILEALALNGNSLAGLLPGELGNLLGLSYLYLDNNDLEGQLPSELGSLQNLQDIRLSDNAFSGTIPSEMGNMILLEYLYMNSNSFVGTIPETFGDLIMMKELHLFTNQLTGSIPPQLGELELMTHLYLDSNALSGALEEQFFFRLLFLEELYLSDNKLTGPLSSNIGNLAMLTRLRLNNNSFSMSIPSEIGNLNNLEECSLENNQFTGLIPLELGKLSNLRELHIDGNTLGGPIPDEICKLTETQVLTELSSDCNGDPPVVDCPCCTQCLN